MKGFILLLILVILGGFTLTVSVSADDFTSTNFGVSDPVIFSGGYSTSSNFGLTSVLSQFAIGTSSSSTFGSSAGFLYFPFVTTPVISATPGNASVALSWTSADSGVGWAVSGYVVGQSTVSGGTYSYSDVGDVTSSTRTGLTNSTLYYFILRVKDGIGNFIATSTEVSATPVAPAGGGGGGGGGGGSGGGGGAGARGGATVEGAIANFSGRAYPGSSVVLLKDGQIVAKTVAGPDARFQISLSGISSGNYTFSLYGEDKVGRRSNPLSFDEKLTTGVTTNITGIYLSPTIAVDKSEVKKGDDIAIFGQTSVRSDVTIQVNSDETLFAKTKSDGAGVYLYNFDTTPLEMGSHLTKAKATVANEISPYSPVVGFKVGTQNILVPVTTQVCNKRGDVNNDCRVNLVDFSIVAYWYKRPGPPAKVDLNGDGKVTLVDFSILAYNWTG